MKPVLRRINVFHWYLNYTQSLAHWDFNIGKYYFALVTALGYSCIKQGVGLDSLIDPFQIHYFMTLWFYTSYLPRQPCPRQMHQDFRGSMCCLKKHILERDIHLYLENGMKNNDAPIYIVLCHPAMLSGASVMFCLSFFLSGFICRVLLCVGGTVPQTFHHPFIVLKTRDVN